MTPTRIAELRELVRKAKSGGKGSFEAQLKISGPAVTLELLDELEKAREDRIVYMDKYNRMCESQQEHQGLNVDLRREIDQLRQEIERLKQEMHLVTSNAGKDLLAERDQLRAALREAVGALNGFYWANSCVGAQDSVGDLLARLRALGIVEEK